MGWKSGLKLRKRSKSLRGEQKRCKLLHLALKIQLHTYRMRENGLHTFPMKKTQGLVVGMTRLPKFECSGETGYSDQGGHDPSLL